MIAGIDGCPGGRWVIVTGDNGLRRLSVDVVDDLAPTIERLRQGDLDAVAVDMPIGLLADGPRSADVEARQLLGPRRASVFPTPVRATLDARDYHDACERSRLASGKAISKQAYHLIDKIRRLDELVEPGDQDRLAEAHPELAFTRLNRGPVEWSKHTARGRELRRILLGRALPENQLVPVLESGVAPQLDLIDAAVLLTTARRLVYGRAIRLGGEIDPTGKRAEVVY